MVESSARKKTSLGYKAAAAKSSSKRKSRRRVAWQGGSCSQEKPKRRITKGDKLRGQGVSGLWFRGSATQSLRSKNPYNFQLSREWRETHCRQEQPRAGQNEDHAGRQMKEDKWRETNEGRSSQEQARMEIMQGDKRRETNEGRGSQEQVRMEITKGDKWRETNEGRSGQEQARMEITKGDKWRETNEGRSSQELARMEIMQGDKWRQEQPRGGQNGDHKGTQMETNEGRLGGSGRDFGDQQPNLWEVRTPNSFQLSGEQKPSQNPKQKNRQTVTKNIETTIKQHQPKPPKKQQTKRGCHVSQTKPALILNQHQKQLLPALGTSCHAGAVKSEMKVSHDIQISRSVASCGIGGAPWEDQNRLLDVMYSILSTFLGVYPYQHHQTSMKATELEKTKGNGGFWVVWLGEA